MGMVDVGDVFIPSVAFFLSKEYYFPSCFVMGLIKKNIEPLLVRTVG